MAGEIYVSKILLLHICLRNNYLVTRRLLFALHWNENEKQIRISKLKQKNKAKKKQKQSTQRKGMTKNDI